MIFNSLGSNFVTWRQAARSLWLQPPASVATELAGYLAEKYHGFALPLYKGREALALALRLAHLPPGSYVAMNGFTCYAVYQAIVDQGFKVEYLDVPADGLDFSAETLAQAAARNPQLKAVIIQNTLGYPADVPGIQAVCQQHDLVFIEDLAHSLDTTYTDGRAAGTVGDFTILSFSQDKVIDAVAGGALIVRQPTVRAEAQTIQPEAVPGTVQLRDRWYPLFSWLIRQTYSFKIGSLLHWLLNRAQLLSKPMADLGAGWHALPAWQCQLAFDQLRQLPQVIQHRRRIAQIYLDTLPPSLLLPTTAAAVANGSCLRFPILVTQRAALLKQLRAHGFHLADIWYDAPIGPAKYLARTNYTHQCPQSEALTEQIFNLPTHLSINPAQAKALANLITVCQSSP